MWFVWVSFGLLFPPPQPVGLNKATSYRLRIRVNFLTLYLADYLLGDTLEHFLDLLAGLGGGLKKHEPVVVGKFLPLLVADLSLILHIDLISHQYYFHFFMTMILDFIKPATHILEGVSFGDIVDQKCSDGAIRYKIAHTPCSRI